MVNRSMRNVLVSLFLIVLSTITLAVFVSGCEDDDSEETKLEFVASYPLHIVEPSGLTYDGTNLWTVSDEDGLIYKIDFEGTILDSIDTEFEDLEGIAWNSDDSLLWVVDEYVSRIYVLDTEGTVLDTINPSFTHTNTYPEGLCYSDDSFCAAIPNAILACEADMGGGACYPLDFKPSGLDYPPDRSFTLYIVSDETCCLYKWRSGLPPVIEHQWELRSQDPEGVAVVGNKVYIVDDSENRLDVYILN